MNESMRGLMRVQEGHVINLGINDELAWFLDSAIGKLIWLVGILAVASIAGATVKHVANKIIDQDQY